MAPRLSVPPRPEGDFRTQKSNSAMTSGVQSVATKAGDIRDGWRGLRLRLGWAVRVNWRAWATLAGVCAASIGFLTVVQVATPSIVGNDGYYHIKLAALMRAEGLKPDFVWLPLTILSANQFVDHHFLFHVLLIPFTFGDLIAGAKWASVLFAASAVVAIWWLLRRQAVPHSAIWALGTLAVSEAFIFRMSMPRAQSLSLTLLVLAMGWLLSGQHRRLVGLGFLYVWLYDAFPLLLLACACYVAAEWMMAGRLRLEPLGYAGVGIGLGLVINPYFPDNLLFIGRHILPKLADATSVNVGSEWYPYDTAQLLSNSGLALLAFVSGGLALGLAGRRMRVGTATALLFGLAIGLMLFQARRFVEYFPAFALIFAAFAWRPLLERAKNGSVLPALAAAGLGLGLWFNLGASLEGAQGSKPAQRFQAASAWLENHTLAGARVFQTDWDDFPRLFFYNTHNTYTLGLDPTYLQLQDPKLYDLWVDLTQGRSEDLSAAIVDSFEAKYVLSDLEHSRFLRAAEQDPEMSEVYRDEFAVVFAVNQVPSE